MLGEEVRLGLPAEERHAEEAGPELFGCRGQLQVSLPLRPYLAVGLSPEPVCDVVGSQQNVALKPPLSRRWGTRGSAWRNVGQGMVQMVRAGEVGQAVRGLVHPAGQPGGAARFGEGVAAVDEEGQGVGEADPFRLGLMGDDRCADGGAALDVRKRVPGRRAGPGSVGIQPASIVRIWAISAVWDVMMLSARALAGP